jgi:hypothetical protein
MKDWMKMMLRGFIDDNWSAFQSYCASGGDEKMADEILKELGGEPE